MESCVKDFLQKKGYAINTEALNIIKGCDDWYANRIINDFHKRKTVQGTAYELNRLSFAKRCCSDDANLCEVVEVNASPDQAQFDYMNAILKANNFDTMYREQLEKISANGTTACYVRVVNVQFLDNGKTKGGEIRLNYVDADGFIPLTVDNNEITEAAFSGTELAKGKKRTTLVLFTLENGRYMSDTHIFDEYGKELTDLSKAVPLGDVKPFAVMRNAEVNNIDHMDGYGLPKILNAIPLLQALDLAYNILFGDLDKGEKLLLVNELLCKFDERGRPITPNEQAKKIFVMLGQKIPGKEESRLVQEYNPEIRVEQITKTFELILSLLSTMFGYGTKKYSFENGQITTATEYIGERQDSMQELNKQRFEAEQYIRGIVKSVLWFSNTYLSTTWNLEADMAVEFDDSYITDKETELERKRNDALSFDIPILKVWYLMEAYNLQEEEARKYIAESRLTEDDNTDPQD